MGYPDRPGVWDEPYWSPVAPDGTVALLLHRVEAVAELIRARGGRPGGPRADRADRAPSELYTRPRKLQEVNERLRQAHAREGEVALHLQEAMLPAPRRSATTGPRCATGQRWEPERVQRPVRPRRPA
ncbi:hypothetical protein [Streptomyces sp. NPDC026092]|uniref:hypothetical protein n=1 Tax=Streptomyces sp. NPDC026092 TaxID=3154797 RepID=UPI0033CF7131